MPKSEKSKTRPGLYKCKTSGCRKQFTVTVGTLFERSHIPLHKWLHAIFLMCASKKGISANQLSRDLEITYKSAWFLCHRVRKAMEDEPRGSKLGGVQDSKAGEVEADETFVGGKVRGRGHKAGLANKTIVFTLVDRSGEAPSFVVPNRGAATLHKIIRENVAGVTHILTDDHLLQGPRTSICGP